MIEEIALDDDSAIRHKCESYDQVVETINVILAANHPNQKTLEEWFE